MNIDERALDFFLAENVLTFGDFTLKSGRKSPYFFNTGKLCSGEQLKTLGELYAAKIRSVPEFADAAVIFGSAYKGIPIAVAAAIALGGEIRSVSDRKEAKTHGDSSAFLGDLRTGDKVVIVDDVITTGGTKFEAIEKLRAFGCQPLGFVIAFDRAEPMTAGSSLTAKEQFEQETGLPVHALADIHSAAAHLPQFAEKINEYLAEFAV
jgi:orotate phosphoribosyltransferase